MASIAPESNKLALLHNEEAGAASSSHAVPVRVRRGAPDNKKAKWQLVAAGVLCIFFMIAEVIGGYYAGSLAIMTDAAHLLSDVAGFLISLFAIWLAERPPTSIATWGYHRVEVLGALASVLLIWLLTGVLVYEAVLRIINPEPVDGVIMFITASGGLLVNLAMMRVLHQGGSHHGHSHGGGGGHDHGHGGSSAAAASEANINVRAAFIHVLGDLLQSVGVMIAAGIVWARPSWHIVDPAITFVFAILVLGTTLGIMRTGIATLLNAVPPGIDLSAIVAELASLPGVANVHDVHAWSFGSGSRVALSVHLVADDPSSAVRGALHVAASHGIGHTTVQVERCGTDDVTACYDANDHIDGCALAVELSDDGSVARIGRPAALTRHHAAGGGCGGLVAPIPGASATSATAAPRHSHSHGHGVSDGHGHDGRHGADAVNHHGHSHGASVPARAPASTAGHGHSHAGGGGHGHAH